MLLTSDSHLHQLLCPQCGGIFIAPNLPTLGHGPECQVAQVLHDQVMALSVTSPRSLVSTVGLVD